MQRFQAVVKEIKKSLQYFPNKSWQFTDSKENRGGIWDMALVILDMHLIY